MSLETPKYITSTRWHEADTSAHIKFSYQNNRTASRPQSCVLFCRVFNRVMFIIIFIIGVFGPLSFLVYVVVFPI